MTGVIVTPDSSTGITVTVNDPDNINVNEECDVAIEVSVADAIAVEVLPGVAFNITQNVTGGGGGGTIERYRHDQTVLSNVWVINHGLGFRPVVQVYDNGGSIIYARIVHITQFQTQVRFCTPRTGYALAGD